MKRYPGMDRTAIVANGARWSGEMLLALLAIPLLLLLSMVVLEYGHEWVESLADTGLFSKAAFAAVLAIGVSVVFVRIASRVEPFDPRVFLVCSLAATAVLYGIYVSSIQVTWVSDFKGMWEHATRMVAQHDYSVRDIYNERALPVLVPLILLFGAKPAMVPVVNIGMLLVVQVLGYDLVRRIAGHRAAQGFVVLWLGAMEPVMALPITSHDIWGLLYLVLFLWGYRVLNDRMDAAPSRARPWWVGAGVLVLAALLTLLDMQRELGPFVVLGFVLAGAVLVLRSGLRDARLRRALLIAASVFVLHMGMAAALKASGAMMTAEQGKTLFQIRVGAYGSSLSNGRYDQGQVITKAFFDTVDAPTRDDIVHVIPLSDFALQPQARLANLLYRVRGQAHLGSQYYFYQAGAKARWEWLVPMTRAYNVCYAIALAVLGLWLVLPLLRRLDGIDALAQLALLSALVGVLLVMGESQPRYVFPLWFILPQLAAVAIATRQQGKQDATMPWRWEQTRGALLLLGAFFVCSLGLRALYVERHGRVLSGWSPRLDGLAADAVPKQWFAQNQLLSATGIRKKIHDTRKFGFGRLALVVKFPAQVSAAGSTGAEKRVCAGSGRTALDFYYFMPYQNPRAGGSFTFEVLLDGRQRWAVPLPGTTAIQHARIDALLAPGHCGTLEFRLTSNRGLSSASWVAASQVDVYFPRLVR